MPRWEWEKSKKVIVFSTEGKLNDAKSSVIRYISELVGEFKIPLEMVDGNSKYAEDLALINEIITKSQFRNEIDYEKFENELRMVRDGGKLGYGIVMLVDKEKYEFFNKLDQQPAIYGIGVEDGLVILRHTHKEAVRHEFAHMLGLDHHHSPQPGCIMNWECQTSTFCDNCKKEIQEIWNEEIIKRKRDEGAKQNTSPIS